MASTRSASPTPAAMRPVRDAWTAAGRRIEDLEVIGGLRPRFTGERGPADLAEAAETSVPPQLAAGYTSFCFNPSQYVDDAARIPAVAREAVRRCALALELCIQNASSAAHFLTQEICIQLR